MKFRIQLVLLTGLIFSAGISSGQPIRQVLRGKIVDGIRLSGIPLANVILSGENQSFGAVSDQQGKFQLDSIPIGRYRLKITHVGYFPYVQENVLLEGGKDLNFEIEMKPAALQLENVEILDQNNFNSLSPSLSSLSFNMEMSDLIPATFYDPARIVTSYPGIAVQNDQSNNISIRGNSPNELVWRIDGLNFVNPNHLTNAGTFSDRPSVSGGGVSIFSAQLIRRSRILTGAFPANFGNALSGVFDIRLREGNQKKGAYSLQAGLLGLEASAEGPFSSDRSSTFLINYRYSTVGLLSKLGVDLGDESLDFQDLSFNLSFDLGKGGSLTVFGIGGLSNERFNATLDSSLWESIEDRIDTRFDSNMGGMGITHRVSLGNRSSWSNRVAFSYISSIRKGIYRDDDYTPVSNEYDRFDQGLLSINSEIRTDWNNFLFTGGVYADRLQFNLLSQAPEIPSGEAELLMEGIGAYWMIQPYLMIEKQISNKWLLHAGLNGLYHSLQGRSGLGPRLGLSFYLDEYRSFKIQYGLVSKTQIPQAYYVVNAESGDHPNKDLDFTWSHQWVAGYEQQINQHTLLRVEGYIQKHFNVPVSPDPENPYSIVNAQDAFISQLLVNEGTALNRGIELTIDRNFYRNYYLLLNGTWYQSTYRAVDGIKRNTRFNGQYGMNFTTGKEFIIDRGSYQRVIGINLRMLFHGGPWQTPIDEMLSRENQKPVYLQDEAFTRKLSDYFRIDLGIYFKKHRNNYTRSIILGVQNATNRQNIAYQYFDTELNRINTKYQLGIIPTINYRVEF
jgi:hypothetical protein